MMFPVTAIAYVPALIGAVFSLGMIRTGILSFLFLLPLGILAFWYNAKTAWFCAFLCFLGNLLVSLGTGLATGYPAASLLWNVFYFAVLTAAFTWIMAPPAAGPDLLRVPTVYRFTAASVVGALALLPLIYGPEGEGFYAMVREQAGLVISLYGDSAGADVVQRSLSEQYITADRVADIVVTLAVRGGVVASLMLLFVFSRQSALALTILTRHKRPEGGLTGFHAPPALIWTLSAALLGVLLGRIAGIGPLEIFAWNILVIAVMLYLAQGGGILFFFLTKLRMPPGTRFLFNCLLCIVIFSPGINVIFLGALVLLGIAENWLPFRALKINGSSSTPGM